MVELKEQHPYIDDNGNARNDLIKHYAENENGEKYFIRQVETGAEYGEAVDVYPCPYTYVATDRKIENEEEIPQEEESE